MCAETADRELYSAGRKLKALNEDVSSIEKVLGLFSKASKSPPNTKPVLGSAQSPSSKGRLESNSTDTVGKPAKANLEIASAHQPPTKFFTREPELDCLSMSSPRPAKRPRLDDRDDELALKEKKESPPQPQRSIQSRDLMPPPPRPPIQDYHERDASYPSPRDDVEGLMIAYNSRVGQRTTELDPSTSKSPQRNLLSRRPLNLRHDYDPSLDEFKYSAGTPSRYPDSDHWLHRQEIRSPASYEHRPLDSASRSGLYHSAPSRLRFNDGRQFLMDDYAYDRPRQSSSRTFATPNRISLPPQHLSPARTSTSTPGLGLSGHARSGETATSGGGIPSRGHSAAWAAPTTSSRSRIAAPFQTPARSRSTFDPVMTPMRGREREQERLGTSPHFPIPARDTRQPGGYVSPFARRSSSSSNHMFPDSRGM